MPILTLPTETLVHIFSFLPWEDHLTASQVCHLWLSIFLSLPTQSNRYVVLNPRSVPCPRMHKLFSDVGLECMVNVFTGQISKIVFIKNELKGSTPDHSPVEATVDLTSSEIIKERLLHFQGWRYEKEIREEEWRMGICLIWNQRGYEYGSPKDREFYRQDWFRFVKNDAGDQEIANDIMRGEVDLDISVNGFIEVLVRHVLKFDDLKLPGQHNMRLALGLYNRMGIVVVRNIRENGFVTRADHGGVFAGAKWISFE